VLSITTGNAPVDSNLHPAVRLNNAYQESPLPAPPLNPEGLTGCQEMDWYRSYVGLPEVFNGLGWRESNCRNDVRTFCCYGYWQEYISLWLSSKSSYRDALINSCGISGVNSIYGLSDKQKLAQACAAKVVYDISGLVPWRQT
jgi:hypothetical protein